MRLSFGYQVLIAVLLGLLAGMFLGPLTGVFKPLASAFVMLLQMVVLPYVSIAIMHGLASMTPSMAKQFFKKSIPFWLLLWGLMFWIVFLMDAATPEPQSIGITFEAPPSSFHEELTKNILALLVPENPISDLVNNILPAIAVFSIIVGVALMFIEKKEPLLSLTERGEEIGEKIFNWLVRISPIAVFAHIAVVSGTINLADLRQYDFYLALVLIAALFFLLWLLPTILSCFTPMSFSESIVAIKNVCLVTFFTGITMIAIPFITSYLKKLARSEPHAAETIVPISYSFAQIGNGLFLFFILFASFYFHFPFTGFEKSLLYVLSIPLSSASSSLSLSGIPVLFKEMNFTDKVGELYSATAPLAISLQAALSAAGIFTLTLLTLYAYNQTLQIKWKPLLWKVIAPVALLTCLIFAIASDIHLEDAYSNLYMTRRISEAIEHPIEASIYLPDEPIPAVQNDLTLDVLERVLGTGVLRVGYDTHSNIPYVYHNRYGELVGFDVAMAYQLARDLNCRLEFIPLSWEAIGDELNEGRYDIAMSAILMTEKRLLQMSFSDTYADQNINLIVPIKNMNEFANLADAESRKGLVIGAVGGYKRAFYLNFPNAIMKEGDWEAELLAGTVDAWISSHYSSIVWCLNHPDFYIYEYGGQLGKCYFAYPVRIDSLKFLGFIDNWIALKIQDNFSQKQTDYWIMGKSSTAPKKPRWSIVRDVLHWVE
jgi:proton glutamate symport protein